MTPAEEYRTAVESAANAGPTPSAEIVAIVRAAGLSSPASPIEEAA